MFDEISKLLSEKGISLYQLSKDTGIPYTCLMDWKSGRCKPKFDKLCKIADYFGVNVDIFAS